MPSFTDIHPLRKR